MTEDHTPPAGDDGVQGTVYLLHFSEPFHHARHYIGWASDLDGRLAHHRNGSGARLTAAASAAGIELEVARTWVGATRNHERSLKDQKNTPRLCPVCNPSLTEEN